jgi:hypothetical protein
METVISASLRGHPLHMRSLSCADTLRVLVGHRYHKAGYPRVTCEQSHGDTVRLGCPVDSSPPCTLVSCSHRTTLSSKSSLTRTWRNADLAPRRKTPAKTAWTQGTNPLTQRPTNNPASNGVVNTSKPAQNSIASGETASPMRHLSDRMMYLLANLTVSDGRLSTLRKENVLMCCIRVFRASSP